MGGKGGCAAFPHRQKGGGRVNNKRTALVRGSKLLHFMLTVGLFAYTWFRFLSDYNIVIARRYQIWACLLYGLLLYFFCRTYNAYLIEYSRTRPVVLVTHEQADIELMSECIQNNRTDFEYSVFELR